MRGYSCMIEVQGWPLPMEVDRRYHYFRDRDRAIRFAGRLDCTVTLHALNDGACLLQPVALSTLMFGEEIYETFTCFPYEMSESDVRRQWSDTDSFGCDCQRSHVIASNGGHVPDMECGSVVELLSLGVTFRSDPCEFELH